MDVYPYELIESYDKGFVLDAGMAIGNLVKIGWIIKLDINGNILWDKKIGNGSNFFNVHGIDNTNDGGLILIGTTDTLNDVNWDPFVVKLNSCGEVEWCRIFQTDMKTDFGGRIRTLKDNSYALLIYDWKEDMSAGAFLYHLSQDGELIWEQEYFAEDTLVNSECPKSLELTLGNDFLITGFCYVPDSGQVTPWWLRPMVILADSSGEAVWELPWGFSSQFIGEAFQTVVNNNNIYTCVSDYPYPPKTGYKPCLIKTSFNGVPVSFHDIKEDTKWGKASTLDKASDSTFLAGMGYAYNDSIGFLSVAKIDTNGFILKEKVIKQSNFIPIDALVSSDQKYLTIALDEVGNNYFTKIWKFNMDLDYDSIYTQSITYDSLCNHSITSETLFFPCDLIVSVREPMMNTEKIKMVVYPNPTRDAVHVRLPECIQLQTPTEHLTVITTFHKWYKDLTLRVSDLTGRMVLERLVRVDEKEIVIAVTDWKPGIYCFTLCYEGKVVANDKVVIN